MAWRLDKSVVRGELHNRVRGRVEGKLWLLGRKDPVQLFLSGNCLRDIAGGVLSFENPTPRKGDAVDLAAVQRGVVGEMTASRKVRLFGVPPEEAAALREAGRPVPAHIGNCLYLEWFSDRNGRVVIESASYRLAIAPPAWRLSAREEQAQMAAARDAMQTWMEHLAARVDAADAEPDAEDLRPMNEFEWERHLKESDALTARFSAMLDKYMDHPERDKLIAREMGWTWLEEALDAKDRGLIEGEPTELDDLPPPEPNPATEGTDWLRTDRGDVAHPLANRAFHVAMDLWHYCDDRELLGDEGDADLHDMVLQAQVLSAKLAGALNGLAYDRDVEGGFVVACLKRALKQCEAVMATAVRVRHKRLVEPARLAQLRSDLFGIREGTLALMQRFRQQS